MRTILSLLAILVLTGCASFRSQGKKATMEFYPGTNGMVTLPPSTLVQVEELLGTLPREIDETPTYTQGVWLKPNLSPAARARAEEAERERKQHPPLKVKNPSNFRPLHGEMIAEISVYPSESNEPEPPDAYGYSIFSDGIRIRSDQDRFLWRLDESSLNRLKRILDASIQEPNQSLEPMPLKRHGSP